MIYNESIILDYLGYVTHFWVYKKQSQKNTPELFVIYVIQ